MQKQTFIIFGASGDLTQRKLIPAIYNLYLHNKIKDFLIVGCARRKIKEATILKEARKHITNKEKWNSFKNKFKYFQLDFSNKVDYKNLNTLLNNNQNKNLTQNRIFYLATAPEHFDKITHYTKLSKLSKNKGYSRIVYEKPFGSDLKSAKKINKCINRVFSENQIYRIDHYLGKELVGNIALMRFTNRIFEPLWNKKHIENIQIIMSEKLGVKDRIGFYNKNGVLKDVIQNHALQLLALMAMDTPKKLDKNYVRAQKAKVLKKTKVTNILLGQYQRYQKETKSKSSTPTFAAIKLKVNTSRFRGVPFYIKAGKNLNKKETTIHIKFKKVKCLLAQSCPTDTNYLTIRIQPNAGFSLELNSKVPQKRYDLATINMDFCESKTFGPNTPQAYEVLFEDILNGDQSIFVRNDEIEYAWKIIDKIKKTKTHTYKKGSIGPTQLKTWSKKNNIQWRS